MKKFFAVLVIFAMLFNICASAIVLDTAEDVVAEIAGEEEAVVELQATELDIPMYDPTYGRLVYYNNFESQELNSNATGTYYTYCNTSFIDATNAPVKVEEINEIKIVDDPVNGGNKVVKVINTGTGRQFSQFWITRGGDFTAVGTYTVVFDVTASANIPIKLRHAEDGSNGATVQVLTTTANKWTTGAKSIELVPYAERDSGTYTVKNGWMHTDYTVSASNVDDASFYIDNVRIYYLPKGKITQESLNIPEGATVYKKAANGEKPVAFALDTTKSNYVSLTDALYVPGYSFLGWYDADGNKFTPDNFTVSGTHGAKAFYAQWKKNAPGLNLLTGTASAADFEDGNTYNIGVGNGSTAAKVNVVDNAVVNAGSGNATKVLHSKGVAQWFQVHIPAEYETNRKYELKYDAFYSAAPNGESYQAYLLDIYSNNGSLRYDSSVPYSENAAGRWLSARVEFQPSAASSGVLSINNKFTSYPTQDFYLDNVYVTPYYEIKYVDLDATEKVVYALRDADGNILTSYTPDSANFTSGATFYKLSEDGEVFSIDTPIALNYEDVKIYAVADKGLDIETTHPVYGELVYYNNYESFNYVVGESAEGTAYTYKTDKIAKDIKLMDDGAGGETQTIVIDPVNAESGNKVVKITTAGGSNPGIFYAYGNISGAGTYTILLDYAADADIIGANFELKLRPRYNWDGNVQPHLNFGAIKDSNRGMWNTAACQLTLVDEIDDTDATYKYFDHMLLYAALGSGYDAANYNYYVDNMRIYFKPYENNALSGVAGSEKVVRFAKTLDTTNTTVDVGNSEAEVVVGENTVTVKATGYSGVVTINAVYTDETTETKTVRILGGDKWKPGLNIITGTTDGLDFEGLTADDVALALKRWDNSSTLVMNPNMSEANNSANVYKITGETGEQYTGFDVNLSEPIEKGRGVFLTMNYMGSWNNNFWLNGVKNNGIQGYLTNNIGDWKKSLIYYYEDSFTTRVGLQTKNLTGTSASSVYLDNLALIPAYKFTYVDVDGTETVAYAIHDAEGKLLTSYTPDAAKFASGATFYKLSENGEVFSIDTPIALNYEDVTIYAVEDKGLDIETTDSVYGELIYYNNFESYNYVIGESAHGTYYTYKTDKITKDISLGDAWGTGSTRTIAGDPVNANADNKVVKVIPGSGDETNPNVFFAYGDISGEGVYTFVVDYTAHGGVENKTFGLEFSPRFDFNNSKRKYYSLGALDESTRGVWNTAAYQFELGDTYTSVGHIIVQSRPGTTGYDVDDYTYYLDNVRIYFKPYETDVANYVASAKEGTATTVRFAKELDVENTTVDAGYSEATVSVSGKKAVVTAVGYAGVVTINAVYTDGATETKTVTLLGGEKWKPGLNVITGTADAFDFEGYTAEEIKIAVNYDPANLAHAYVAENPLVNESNASELVLVFDGTVEGGGNGWGIVDSYVTQVIENERKVFTQFDFYNACDKFLLAGASANKQNRYATYNFGSSVDAENWNHYDAWWKDGDVTADLYRIRLQSSGATKTYVDNLAFIPGYKITYVDVDGTTKDVYALEDAEGKLLTEYTPVAANFASGSVKYKLSEDGEVFSINTPIALEHKDIKIYAVDVAPVASEKQDMRFDGEEATASIKFNAVVGFEMRSEAVEYGMLVTRKALLDTMAEKKANGENVETELTFNFNYNGADLFLSGEAYKKVGSIVVVDKHSNIDEDGNYTMSAVLKGITNNDAYRVNDVFVVRSYIKFDIDGVEYVCYGETVENSLVNVAKDIDRTGLSEAQTKKLDDIVALAN